MDPVETNSITDDPDQTELTVRPTLSQVRKSWGFRRTTIARREFMDEVGDLTHSPPLVRRGRSRRTHQTPQTTTDTRTTQKATYATRSVLDDLEWSAPSSPVSQESKQTIEASAGGSLDPSLWQDFGSAFHTAFSLLGGNEGLSMDLPDAVTAPDILEGTDTVETLPSQTMDETQVSDKVEPAEDMDISLPVSCNNVAGEEIEDVHLISSQEEDSDEMTLIQIKEQLASKVRQGDTSVSRGKGVKGRARRRRRGRGRGKGKGRGRGRGRGRAIELQSSIADSEESDDEVVLVNPGEQLEQLQEEEKSDLHSAIQISSAASDITMSPAQHSSPDCIIIDSELDQTTDVTPGQYDDAQEEEEVKVKKKGTKNVGECLSISDTEGSDPNAQYCICRQKHDKRFMICCDSCQGWFHSDCVGIVETQCQTTRKTEPEYICPHCNTKKQLQSDYHPQPEHELSVSESPSGEQGKGEQQALKETVDNEEKEADPEPEMQTNDSLHLCIGPGCSKQALPDSGYCGTDCILQHAAVTMKTLAGPKVPKSRGRAQRKAATFRPTTKGQRSGRTSKRLAGKAEEEGEDEEMKEDDGGRMETASSLACNADLKEVQIPSIPSSQFYTASAKKNIKEVDADSEAVTQAHAPEDMATDVDPSSQLDTEPAPPQSDSQVKRKEPGNSDVSKQLSAESDPPVPQSTAKSVQSPSAQSPSTSGPRHHETGALIVSKTTYVIPKKQAGPQPPTSGHILTLASCQNPSSAPTLLGETRNLLVPPAPSAPSSRPSQPNNQVRQSIQRTLSSILLKRVCDCDDLEMSESDVAKLVASIEMEMFDIFRNTDSKYMNKYRTIMFNLKDPRNKGLLYRLVRGEISTFRLVRMSQKDMQAIQAPEPSAKAPEVKDVAAEAVSLGQKPGAVKVELPSLNPAKLDRRPDKRPDSTEQKRSLAAPALKTRGKQPSLGSAAPDILTSMLKDTTSEHKAHLFDLKCKICTGQIQVGDEDEPVKKKPKVSETRNKREPSWRQSAGGDSPLRAPPDSPDTDSPTTPLMDPTSRLIIDSPSLTIVESPASPTMDSPASPVLESPASPVMERPTSPTQDAPTANLPKRAYTPVVIPAVSTVTITRRDPRTAASRFSALSGSTIHNQPAPYASVKETSSTLPTAPLPSLPPIKPKSILMKPSTSADPRLYGTSSRTMISESTADSETVQFLAKQEILWKGFVNMVTVAKFVTKGYLVSGTAEILKADLPDTIQIGGRILPQTVWEYVGKLKTSLTKELCVIRFHPATEEEEVAYVSLFSYFSSRGRFGVIANNSRSIKDIYLVPLSAKESIPSMLQPLEGPGLEKRRPNLLLGLAIVQKTKRPGNLAQEIEEKRPNVPMSKDPMWIPKPPILYGSDKLEIFQPYDPETPASSSPPGSPSDSSSSGSVTTSSLLTSVRAPPPVSSPAVEAATRSNSNSMAEKNLTTASSGKTPLQTILKTLFSNKQADTTVSSDVSCTARTIGDKKTPVFSQASRSIVDPIVQQYGQKSKVKDLEQDENDFDRPYDPEEEYDPAIGYGIAASQKIEKNKSDGPKLPTCVDDDVAYDPEDETIFEDIKSETVVAKPLVPSPASDSLAPHCPTSPSTQLVAQATTSSPAQTSTSAILPNLPTGTVVVSAATLTEQQRMLEELNKQIEEQKRQLKEQEEALRQQREAVGIFMAHFSVSDSLMSPPNKISASHSTDKTSNLTESMDKLNADSQIVKQDDTTAIVNLKKDMDIAIEKDETQEDVKECDKYSSAGEIEDSDVAYDPEDESLFNEIQDDVFQGSSVKSCDSSLSRARQSGGHKGASSNSHHSRKRRLSPKRRSHRERDRHRSPSKRSERRSPSHSRRRRERDRHRRSERDRSKHRARDQSEHQAHHRKEHTVHRRSRGHRRSPSSPRKKHSVSLSPKENTEHREPSPQVFEKSEQTSIPCSETSVTGQFLESNILSSAPVTIKNDPDGNMQSADKDLSLCSHELLTNVKLESSEEAKSHEVQKDSAIHQDDKGQRMAQEILFNDKLESTIPLREIDPPIRDSPESPDPEPQFVKHSSTEKIDSVETEEKIDSDTHTSVLLPCVKVENTCLAIGGQVTVSDLLWPAIESPMSDAGNMNVKNLQVPCFGHKGMIEADKQTQDVKTGLKHLGIEHVTGSCVQAMTSSIWGLEHIQDPETAVQSSETNMREQGIRQLKTDRIGSAIRNPLQNFETSTVRGINPKLHCQDTKQGEQEIRGQPFGPLVMKSNLKIPNARSSVTDVDENKCFGNIQIEHTAPDLMGGTGHSNIVRGGGVIEPGPSFQSPQNIQRQSTHSDNAVFEESCPQKRDCNPHVRHSDFSGVGHGRAGSLDPKASIESNIVRADVPSPAVTFEWQGPKRDGSSPITGLDSTRFNPYQIGAHFRESHNDRTESAHSFDISNSDITHELRRQDMDCIDKSGDRTAINAGTTGRNIGEMCPNRSHAAMQEINIQGPGLEWRNEKIFQEHRETMPNINSRDGRGPEADGVGPNMRNRRSQNKDQDPHRRDIDWNDLGSDLRDDRRETKRRGAVPGRRRPIIHQLDRREPNMETLGPNGLPGCPELMEPISDMNVLMHDSGRLGGPDSRRREPERKAPPMDNLGPGVKGQGTSLAMGAPGIDWRRDGGMDGQEHDTQGPLGPDFMAPWPERRGPDMVGPGPDRKGPRSQDFWGKGSEMGHEPERQGPEGLDFKGAVFERRGLTMRGARTDRLGPSGLDFRGIKAESRGSSIESPGPDRREFQSECFWGQGPENSPGPDSRGPIGPGFSGPGAERRGPTMGPMGPERRLEAPDYYALGPDRRGPSLVCLGPERRELENPSFRGPGHEWRGPTIEGQGPNRRGKGDQNTDALGPDRRGSYIGRPGPDFRELGGPHFRDSRLGTGLPNMENPGPGSRGSDIRGQWLEGPGMKGLGSVSRGPRVENFISFPPDNEENNLNFPQGGQFGGPELEKRPDMKGTDIGRRGPRFRKFDPEKTEMERQGKGQRGPGFRRPGCERRGPDTVDSELNRQELERPFLDGPGPDWRKSDCPDFRGPRIRQRGQNMEGSAYDSRDEWGGSEFRVQETMQEAHNYECPGPERGPWPMRRNRPGIDSNSLNQGESISTEDQWSDRRRPIMGTVLNETESLGNQWKRHINRSPSEQGQDRRRQGPRGEWRGIGSNEPLPIQERSESLFMGGPEDDYTGPRSRGPEPIQDNQHVTCPASAKGGSENEWKEPVRWPHRGAHGVFPTGQRHADNEGKPPGITESDMGNDWRQTNFREKGPNKGAPGAPHLRHMGPGNRNSNIEWPETDGFSECGALRTESPGLKMESHRSARRGFEYNFRRERRGADVRTPGLDKSSDIKPRPDRWDSNTEVRGSDTRGQSKVQTSDFRGLGYVNREADMNVREPGERGQTSTNERRGPAFRHLDKSAHLNNPQHVSRFTRPSHPHSAPFTKPPAPAPHSGVKRHRAALLPTPTEGLIRFPNHVINNPDAFSLKQKPFSQPADRE